MKQIPMYHDGSRRLQDRFGSRQLAERLVDVLARVEFTDSDRAFIDVDPSRMQQSLFARVVDA